jgi:hypothetical protein
MSGPILAEHAYLHTVTPLVLALLVVAAAEFGLLLVHASAYPREAGPGPSLCQLWVSASAALVAVYATQETLEGYLGGDLTAGLARVFGAGGWIVIVLALAIGGLIAILLRGSAAALERVASRQRRVAPADGSFRLLPPLPCRGATLNVVARFLAGRGPPPNPA